jgi:riboflavin kinase/FMN adenylyltransferase
LEHLRLKSRELSAESVVLTFNPHPRRILFPDETDLALLTTLEEKINQFDKAGIEHLIIHTFDSNFSKLKSSEFIEKILHNSLGIKHLLVGYDHHFGSDRLGNIDHIKLYGEKFGFTAEKCNAFNADGTNISSTKIRNLLKAGEIVSANQLLGYEYSITGKVTEGHKIGRQIGFPTANIQVSDSLKLIPSDGVYAVEVSFDKNIYRGMLNIGKRPTFDGLQRTVEVHIFDFIGTIYDKEITLRFKKYIREERRFNSSDELIIQLKKDKNTTENFFESLILK